jgi:hypothetical protein
MDALWQDLRFGVRMLLRSPLTAGLAVPAQRATEVAPLEALRTE